MGWSGRAPAPPAIEAGKGRQDKEHAMSQTLNAAFAGLKPWIEAARKRLHHNVLAIALANKLARIARRPEVRQTVFDIIRSCCCRIRA
jgi:hypothetical protein